jgi:hypothetical protein
MTSLNVSVHYGQELQTLDVNIPAIKEKVLHQFVLQHRMAISTVWHAFSISRETND